MAFSDRMESKTLWLFKHYFVYNNAWYGVEIYKGWDI